MSKTKGKGDEVVNRKSSTKHTNNKGFTREEEHLLQDFSRNISKKSSLIFHFNAFVVSAIPIWLYWRIHMMDPVSSVILFIVITAISTHLVAFAYKNTKFLFKHKVAQKLEDAVTKEMTKKFGDNKKMNKKERDERILWKKNEIADSQATTFALFYNNALFLMIVILGAFLIFRTISPTYNYTLSTLGAAGLIALFSTGTH